MRRYLLDQDELKLVEEIRLTAVDGLYRLSELFGEAWVFIIHKTSFGIRFKRTVEAGLIPGVTLYAKTVENHRVYLVTNPVVA